MPNNLTKLKLAVLILVALILILGVFIYLTKFRSVKNLPINIPVPPDPVSSNPPAVNRTTIEIEYTDEGFRPGSIKITRGSTLKWVNLSSSDMTIVSSEGSTESFAQVTKGDEYSYTFSKTGTNEYINKNAPEKKGTVEVIK